MLKPTPLPSRRLWPSLDLWIAALTVALAALALAAALLVRVAP